MTNAIAVERLSKRYFIGHQREHVSFREAAAQWLTGWMRPQRLTQRAPLPRAEIEEFWALRDVSFEVEQGERVGIIGANGAGKSTLLKILSRVTKPTSGRVVIAGRVSSLLEVGTGFHPELTGRENVYLNGAILGMRAGEIRRKFDEIVSFAEVEQFLDTPVKRYSSGMYVRLAFAVAAHLDPDILIVDEVLAVGDARFQRKSLGKMATAAQEGRTVIFVSHSMAAIKNLCHSAILLEGGRATAKLPVDEAVNRYLSFAEPRANTNYPVIGKDVELYAFHILQNGTPQAEYDAARDIDVDITFRVLRELSLFRIGIIIRSRYGDILLRSLLADWDPSRENMRPGDYRLRGKIPGKTLIAGTHVIQVDCSRFGLIDYGFWGPTATELVVRAPKTYNSAHSDEAPFGAFYIDAHWELIPTAIAPELSSKASFRALAPSSPIRSDTDK